MTHTRIQSHTHTIAHARTYTRTYTRKATHSRTDAHRNAHTLAGSRRLALTHTRAHSHIKPGLHVLFLRFVHSVVVSVSATDPAFLLLVTAYNGLSCFLIATYTPLALIHQCNTFSQKPLVLFCLNPFFKLMCTTRSGARGPGAHRIYARRRHLVHNT